MNTTQHIIQTGQPSGYTNIYWQCLPFLILFVIFGLAIFATVRCVKRGQSGLPMVLWLLIIWLVPIAGSLAAIFAARSQTPAS